MVGDTLPRTVITSPLEIVARILESAIWQGVNSRAVQYVERRIPHKAAATVNFDIGDSP
jgi:hypothetical protein